MDNGNALGLLHQVLRSRWAGDFCALACGVGSGWAAMCYYSKRVLEELFTGNPQFTVSTEFIRDLQMKSADLCMAGGVVAIVFFGVYLFLQALKIRYAAEADLTRRVQMVEGKVQQLEKTVEGMITSGVVEKAT